MTALARAASHHSTLAPVLASVSTHARIVRRRRRKATVTFASNPAAVGAAPDVLEVLDGETAASRQPSTREGFVQAVDRDGSAPTVMATVHLDGPTNTMSHAFKVGADDGNEYWIKTLEGVEPHHRPSLALEQVISRFGVLLGIAVVQPYLVRIPDGMKLPTMSNGRDAQPGLAHASRAYEACVERKAPPERRSEDDNRRRHAGIFALLDLARGADLQYLYDANADGAIISHDHGLYVCHTGTMDVAAMIATVADPGIRGGDATGLDAAEIERVADRLDACTANELVSIVNLVPPEWPVTDEQVGTLAWFLHSRAKPVALRVRGHLS